MAIIKWYFFIVRGSILGNSKSVVVTLGPGRQPPWWWEPVKQDRGLCDLEYVRIDFKGKRSQQIKTSELPAVFLKILRWLFNGGKNYDYIYTFECDWPGFIISFWQTILFLRKPRHVILQFIMREKQASASSAVKYAVMEWLFSSVYRIICSSRKEAEYYRQVFKWRPEKVEFVLLHTAGELSTPEEVPSGAYFLAAGRTFRDYDTLVAAIAGTSFRVVLVGGAGCKEKYSQYENVDARENIPLQELSDLMRNAKAVVVPLENRKISIGQSIILQAMAMSKPVIATRTAGTEDYIQHLYNGVLVEPGDAEGLTEMMNLLDDDGLYQRICSAAHQSILERHLPHHYTEGIRRVLGDSLVDGR